MNCDETMSRRKQTRRKQTKGGFVEKHAKLSGVGAGIARAKCSRLVEKLLEKYAISERLKDRLREAKGNFES